MSNHDIVTDKLVMLTDTASGIKIEGPGWALSDFSPKSARVTPGTRVYVDILDSETSAENGRDIYAAQRILYKDFRLNHNFGVFSSAAAVVDYINARGAAVAPPQRTLTRSFSGDFNATLGSLNVLDNTAGPITVTLPETTLDDVGMDIVFYMKGAPKGGKVRFDAANTSQTINGQAAVGDDVAKADYRYSLKIYDVARAVLVDENEWIVQAADKVYAQLIYSAVTDNLELQDFETNALDFDGIPADIMGQNQPFFFAMKFNREVGDLRSNYQNLLSTDQYSIVAQPSTGLVGVGQPGGAITPLSGGPGGGKLEGWMVVSYNGSISFSVWQDGVKTMDNASYYSGMASTQPTSMTLFSRNPVAGTITNPLLFNSCSMVVIGTGTLTQEEAVAFDDSIDGWDDLPQSLKDRASDAFTFDANGCVTRKGSLTGTFRTSGGPTEYFFDT
jgi:hypothetical protein